jgi:Tol biopolymer transport system component
VQEPARRLTDGGGNDQLLYFTGPSLTSDDRRLVFLSDRRGRSRLPYDPAATVDLYVQDLATGVVDRLSDSPPGLLRSYVYFEGRQDRGFGMASPALADAAGLVFWIQDRTVMRADLGTGARVAIAELPPGHATGYGAATPDGSRYCVPAIESAAFRDVDHIDATVQALGLKGYLWIVDTGTGSIDQLEIPRGWVTHVQFQPGDPTRILYNHEWTSTPGTRRMWLADANGLRPLRTLDSPGDVDARLASPRAPDDWVDHEMWSADGSWIVYHGQLGRSAGRLAGRHFVGRVEPDSGRIVEIALPQGFEAYGHVAVAPDGSLVTDGLVDFAADGSARPAPAPPPHPDGREEPGGAWISRIDVDWDSRTVAWHPLCRSGTSWSSQDCHPHPRVDHAGREVLFTSDVDGSRAAYAVLLR